ncbi:peroxide stress protein YaaA [Pseudomonadota bacterium]
MLLVISPAKTLDYTTPPKTATASIPDYLDDAQQLINRARQYSVQDIEEIMKVSSKIAELNFERFKQWQTPFSPDNAKQALLAFKGDVYTGLDAESFSENDFTFAQQHLRILSGLYGLLRPLDLMQAYRLEMGRKIDSDRGNNLYNFWGEIITDGLNKQLEALNTSYLINLASNEYFKSVKPKSLNAEIITPEFKDYKNGQYKIMGVYAKKARGMLSRFVIQNGMTDPEGMKAFNQEGYAFNEEMSSGNSWVFSRKK